MDISFLFPPSGNGSNDSGDSGDSGSGTCELKPYVYEGVSAGVYLDTVNLNSQDYQLIVDGVELFKNKIVCSFHLFVDNQSDDNSAFIKVNLVREENTEETLDEVEIPKGIKGIPMSFDMIARLKIYGKGDLKVAMIGYYIDNNQKTAEPVS